jgi:metallo-beta-lactamase family protein
VFVDSPLAAQASAVTFRHLEALDEFAHEFHAAERARKLPFALRYTESVDDSVFLNSIHNGALIIAASGMCEAGRIRHHLRHNLFRRECGILFTGFQATGTMGRRIIDGARSVQLFGDTVPVRASVHTLGGLSAHAGQDGLMGWLSIAACGDDYRARRTRGLARAVRTHRARAQMADDRGCAGDTL